jgi:hypothetical protein
LSSEPFSSSYRIAPSKLLKQRRWNGHLAKASAETHCAVEVAVPLESLWLRFLLGHSTSETDGMQTAATWLATVFPGMPIHYVSSGEPYWLPGHPTQP